MKKRFMEIMLTAVIATTAFTGCGKSQTMAAQGTITETTEPETEPQIESDDMVYLDDYVLPKWKAPDEVCQMLDNGAVFFENTELPDMPLNDRQGKLQF